MFQFLISKKRWFIGAVIVCVASTWKTNENFVVRLRIFKDAIKSEVKHGEQHREM